MKKRKFYVGGYTDQEAADLMERNVVPKRESIRLTSDEPATKQSAADQAAEDAAMAREARRSMPVAKPVVKAATPKPAMTGMMRDDVQMMPEPTPDYSDQNSRSVRSEKRFTGKETAAESDMIDRINASAKEQKAKKEASDSVKSIANMEYGYPKEKAPVYKRGDMGRNEPIGDLMDMMKSNANKGKVPQRSKSPYSNQDSGSGFKYKSGGSVASKRGDGIAQRGKTKGKMC